MKGRQVIEGVVRFVGKNPGPTAAIVGGVHGDEATGIQVVRALTHEFNQGEYRLARGVLYLVLGNLAAIAKNEASIEKHHRGSTPGADLNRCFTDGVLYRQEGNTYEHRRARELAKALVDVDIGIDIHATSKPSEPFVFCQRMPTSGDERIMRWFGATRVLTDPQWIFAGKRVALDEYFARHGGVGLCYETGEAKDTSRTSQVHNEMLNVLIDLQLIGSGRGIRRYKPFTVRSKGTFALETAVMCPGLGYRWRTGQAERNFQSITGGLFHPDAPTSVSDGRYVIVFPKPESRWDPGQPVGYAAAKKG